MLFDLHSISDRQDSTLGELNGLSLGKRERAAEVDEEHLALWDNDLISVLKTVLEHVAFVLHHGRCSVVQFEINAVYDKDGHIVEVVRTERLHELENIQEPFEADLLVRYRKEGIERLLVRGSVRVGTVADGGERRECRSCHHYCDDGYLK